jgi:hypothetical protein
MSTSIIEPVVLCAFVRVRRFVLPFPLRLVVRFQLVFFEAIHLACDPVVKPSLTQLRVGQVINHHLDIGALEIAVLALAARIPVLAVVASSSRAAGGSSSRMLTARKIASTAQAERLMSAFFSTMGM